MRIDIRKTYKLYIGGAFPRSESGRTYEVRDAKSKFIANPAQASRKDLRDAVTAARSAFGGWSSATAFNRSQILYRIAEMMEARSEEFVEEIVLLEGISRVAAKKEVDQAIDAWVWYSGWCDKISTVAGSTNPISGPFYNFTVPESLGVVGVFPAQKSALLGLVRAIAPVIAGGNTAVVVASQKFPLCAVTLSEALATSDLPGGVVNILTGITSELAPWMGAHMDVDAIDATGLSKELDKEVRVSGADNLKRIHKFSSSDTPQRMLAFMEYKTVWHPIGI